MGLEALNVNKRHNFPLPFNQSSKPLKTSSSPQRRELYGHGSRRRFCDVAVDETSRHEVYAGRHVQSPVLQDASQRMVDSSAKGARMAIDARSGSSGEVRRHACTTPSAC